MSDRKAVIKAWVSPYRKAEKKERGRILDEPVALTGYNRWYASTFSGGQRQRILIARAIVRRPHILQQ